MNRRKFLKLSGAAGAATALELMTKGTASASPKGGWDGIKHHKIRTGEHVAFLEAKKHKGGFKATYSEYNNKGDAPNLKRNSIPGFQASFDGETFRASLHGGRELEITGFHPDHLPVYIIDKTLNELDPAYAKAPPSYFNHGPDTLTIKYGDLKIHDGKTPASGETVRRRTQSASLLQNARNAILALHDRTGEQATISLEGKTYNTLALSMITLRYGLYAHRMDYGAGIDKINNDPAADRRQQGR